MLHILPSSLICTSFEKGLIVASSPQDELIPRLRGHHSTQERTFPASPEGGWCAGWLLGNAGECIQKMDCPDSLELGDFGQSDEYPLVMNMPCLFLVPLNAIKERTEALTRPPRHLGTHQSSRALNNAVGGPGLSPIFVLFSNTRRRAFSSKRCFSSSVFTELWGIKLEQLQCPERLRSCPRGSR